LIQLGNAIDYSFLDISSQADLFYCQRTAELIAVSSYNADNSSSLSLHSIAFPLQLFISQTVSPDQGKPSILWYLGGALLVLIAAFIAIRRAKKRDEHPQEAKPAAAKHEIIQKPKENSIILFGGFQVIDKSGKDITAKFTPLPKKLFLFILLHSLRNNKGVSSNTMYETFWFDKSVESARNNRAVNIVKLKSLLENVNTASISKETGYWKLDFDPSLLYVDYLAYLQIVNSGSEPTREDMVSLLNIVENKPFLNNTNADWLDPYKSEVSNQIIDTFLKYLENSEDDPEFLLHLTKCIFIFDAVSEEALRVQCRLLIKQGKHSLARQAYSSFIHEYKQLYDEDYGLSFSQVIDET
jgi:two-component SAPR family response regulator